MPSAALVQADWLSVRDFVTQAALRAEGIAAPLCPDPAVMVEQCFGEVIRRHQRQGAVKDVLGAFPRGYLACQFSADFADDASLDALAQGLSKVAAATGLGVALFCAGTTPWHDDPARAGNCCVGCRPASARLAGQPENRTLGHVQLRNPG